MIETSTAPAIEAEVQSLFELQQKYAPRAAATTAGERIESLKRIER